MSVALVTLTEAGEKLARRLQPLLPGALVHARAGRGVGDIIFSDTIEHLQGLFRDRVNIVALCSSGIVIRALAPLLADKTSEPAVLVVAEDGSAVVPLLGGHRGANPLARALADHLGIAPAITTAGDLGRERSLADLPPGWRMGAGPRTEVLAALVNGTPVACRGASFAWPPAEWFQADAALAVEVTWRAAPSPHLHLHPPVLTVGVGTERNAAPAAVIALVDRALAEAGLAAAAVAAVVSLDLKRDEPAVWAVARHLGVPARFYAAAELAAEAPRVPNPSPLVAAETGTPSVAEAAALAAAGPQGTLLVPKRKGPGCTVAIALAPAPLDARTLGRAPGQLSIVGTGPGAPMMRTAEVAEALAAADAVVGYGLYLDLVADLIHGKPRYATALGEETARARLALDLAGGGQRVCLVCSGDPGVYALATLVMELQDRVADPAWRGVEVTVLPGISAMQVAAARLGAPLGHDFCAISLSDLLTPWAVIEARVRAAAAGDFVVAFYNPRSERRTTQLPRALALLAEHRSPTTPVALARDLGRPDERVTLTTLAEVEPAAVDMLTLVLVGASNSRVFATNGSARCYTPRGYDPAARA